MSTTVYTMNWVLIKKGKDKTPYEYSNGRTPNVSYFKVFGSKCYIRRREHLSNFDAKCDEVIFLRYSTKTKALKCYNNKTQKSVESINVRVDESPKEPEETCNKQAKDEQGVAFWEPVKKETSCKHQKDLSVPIPVEAAVGKEEDEVEEEKEKQA